MFAIAVAGTAPAEAPDPPVVVASKPFAESYLLAEMFAQLLEASDLSVDRRPGLGSTEVCFRALVAGEIDVYPEYTGTGLLAVLGRPPVRDRRQAFDLVAREFEDRWGLRWLPPLGFENTYAIAVRPDTAARHGLRDLSDLAAVSESFTAGLSPDFIGREDGLPGLEEAYGLRFEAVRGLMQAVKFRALADGRVDVIDAYSTDGRLARRDLVALRDDRGFFPPYEAAPLVSRRLWTQCPDAVRALVALAGRLDEATMRRLNAAVEVDGSPPDVVARELLTGRGLLEGDETAEGTAPPAAGFDLRRWVMEGELARLTLRHLLLVVVSVAAGVAVAVPVALLLERRRRWAGPVLRAVGVLQTIPSIALLAFMIPLFGIGVVPALVALFGYSLLPILQNAWIGLRDADPAAVETATAIGMTPAQVLTRVRLPLAVPVMVGGIRTAAVISVGTATLAAFIGAGGLGEPIVTGLALSDTRRILAGAIPAAALALAVDGLLGLLEAKLRPVGVAG
jgi:osmoprotectant transport system permease protein